MVATSAHQSGRRSLRSRPSTVNVIQKIFLLHVSILVPAQLFFRSPNVYKGAMKRSLLSVAQALQAHLVGDGAVEVSGIASIALATSADLVFVEDEKSLLRGAGVSGCGGHRG